MIDDFGIAQCVAHLFPVCLHSHEFNILDEVQHLRVVLECPLNDLD